MALWEWYPLALKQFRARSAFGIEHTHAHTQREREREREIWVVSHKPGALGAFALEGERKKLGQPFCIANSF